MSRFTAYNRFRLVSGRTYRLDPNAPMEWHIGKPDSVWILRFWAHDTADVTIPVWAEPLVWLGLVDPHDPDLVAAAFVHDKLLRDGFDKRFAAAEFRRAFAARIERAIRLGRRHPLARWLVQPDFLAVSVYTVRRTGHQA